VGGNSNAALCRPLCLTQTLYPISLLLPPSPSCLLCPININANIDNWRHLLDVLLSVLLVFPSPASPGKRITETVSSPSDLGTRLGVSTGTSVDPWIVRPIKGTLDEVATCLALLIELSLQLRYRRLERHTRRCRRFSAQTEESGDHTISYVPHRQRYTGLV
jgi:hypothetical protein